MPMPAPRRTDVQDHPGSSAREIAEEPEWGAGHQHRIGFRNRQDRFAGFTHDGDHGYEKEEDREFTEDAMRKYRELRDEAKKGKLVNFQELMKDQTDFRHHRLDMYPPGFRFVVRAREDWVKKEQAWPANIKQWEKEEQQTKEQEGKDGNHSEKDSDNEDHDDESEWRQHTGKGGQKHHGAYGKSGDQQHGDQEDIQPNGDR